MAANPRLNGSLLGYACGATSYHGFRLRSKVLRPCAP